MQSKMISNDQELIQSDPALKTKREKALQALHDTPPLCLFLLLHRFWHKKISNVTTNFDQIH